MASNGESSDPPHVLRLPASLWERDWFGPFVLIGFFAFIMLGVYRQFIPGDLIGAIVGYMAGWIASVINFKYGSTSGSRSKDQTIRDLSIEAKAGVNR